jgi:hypothetical protein
MGFLGWISIGCIYAVALLLVDDATTPNPFQQFLVISIFLPPPFACALLAIVLGVFAQKSDNKETRIVAYVGMIAGTAAIAFMAAGPVIALVEWLGLTTFTQFHATPL